MTYRLFEKAINCIICACWQRTPVGFVRSMLLVDRLLIQFRAWSDVRGKSNITKWTSKNCWKTWIRTSNVGRRVNWRKLRCHEESSCGFKSHLITLKCLGVAFFWRARVRVGELWSLLQQLNSFVQSFCLAFEVDVWTHLHFFRAHSRVSFQSSESFI